MNIHLQLENQSYDIIVQKGGLSRASEYFNFNRKVCIVTDSGVPAVYAQTVKAQCQEAVVVTIEQGEEHKTLDSYVAILTALTQNGFTRTDCVVAVGGGVVGDVAGFAAASYMRGIDFYNIPTTLLAMVDSSVGGKTAVDFMGVKNIVGAFYQPKGVLADVLLLSTLSARHMANGIAESIKMSLTCSKKLWSLLKKGNLQAELEEIIAQSIAVKKEIVEQDEKESGLRRVLNFGHTLGHGIEAEAEMKGLLHGECVAIGMIPMCGESVRKDLVSVLEKWNLPTVFDGDLERAIERARQDKKCDGNRIYAVYVDEVGSFRIEKQEFDDWKEQVKRSYGVRV